MAVTATIKNYKFKLASNSIKKGVCPKCEESGQFQFYKGLPFEYGKCERKNSCGYHNDPTKETDVIKEQLYSMVNNTLPNIETTTLKKLVVPSAEQLKVLENHNSTFHKFCIEVLHIPLEHLQKWNVGTDNKGNTAFVLQEITGKYAHIKYTEFLITEDGKDCKRNKKKNPFYLKANENEQYKKCLYGEHLLEEDKTVCVVEAEKTAEIASWFYPQFCWVATGGASGLKIEAFSLLKGRQVYYVGDNDKAGKENSTLKYLELSGIDFKKVFFETAKDGEDLADLIIRGERPEINAENVITIPVNQTNKSNKDEEDNCFNRFSFFERNNQYYTKIQTKQSLQIQRISNFKMDIKCKIENGTDNIPVLLELTREDGNCFLYEIESKKLLSDKDFSATILKSGCNYNGTHYIFKNIIESLHNDKNTATQIPSLGQFASSDFYAFYNGILDTNGQFKTCDNLGLVEFENKTYYIPSANNANQTLENFENERKFFIKNGSLTLTDFANSIFTIYGLNGLIGLCYTIATIHRDIIFNETKCFPFVFLYGGRGSGKSTYINFFMSLFGEPQPETTSTSTQKAIERSFAKTSNNIHYIKEFSHEFENKITDILKNAYDGTGYSRAHNTNDNKTKTLKVTSGLIIDGNYFPTNDSALFSRLIFLTWQPNFTETTKQKIQTLQDELKKGNGLIFTEIYKQRTNYKERFTQLYRQLIGEIKNTCKSKKIVFTEREISHIVILVAVLKISLNPNAETLKSFIDTVITSSQKQAEINNSIDDINNYFETIGTMANQNKIINGIDYKIENGNNKDYLILNYNNCYYQYAKYLREIGSKKIISENELKQKIELNISQEWYNAKNKKESYTVMKFNDGKTARSFIFEVGKGTFELIK